MLATEKRYGQVLLDYDRSIRPQTTSWSCGPGSAEIVLDGLGIRVSEQQLIKDIGATTNGTDYVGLITDRALNKYDPAGKWKSVYLEKDPATQSQKDALWNHILQSIAGNGRGLVLNFVVPPWKLTAPKITSGGAPATASSAGAAGQVAWDADYIYVCTATNTWKRAASSNMVSSVN